MDNVRSETSLWGFQIPQGDDVGDGNLLSAFLGGGGVEFPSPCSA